ncbi:Fe-Mn family superoxide dismutase [Paenibacillus sanguinis]|uniref:Fe-Mn family superoxide dismutase n=1 Tax=Paenibacillus sanguinis TaxID=225906 RepID=UPI00036D9C91|nr:Fe-Mn family superoxide dismutase [Paenibacillus sanguinis]
MLLMYGPYLPIRILEDIRSWKQEETEHTKLISSISGGLEEDYAELLEDWRQVFSDMEAAADRLLRVASSDPDASFHADELPRHTERLLGASFRQSQQFVSQLQSILEHSRATQSAEAAPFVREYIIPKSQYYLNRLEGWNQPGEIMRSVISWTPPLLPVPLETGGWRSPHAEGQPVPIGGHTLPPLPYPYDALEPYIDEKTMRIHHDKHHQTYVDDLNKAEKKLQEARKSGNFDLVKHWERELAFNGAGHYLHTIFWDIMNPEGGGKPEGELMAQIKRDFGSYEAFHKQFSEAAAKVEGGGWAILVWSPRSHRLEILTAEKHQNLSQWDVVPLLTLDVWEHAYYLKHQNARADYIKDWWNVVYWPAVAQRFEAARQLKWQPY